MSNNSKRLEELTELITPADSDNLYVLDVSDTTDSEAGSSRKITLSNMLNNQLVGASIWPRSALEIANSITPTDLSFPWGNVFRYGAVADSALGAAGTDSTTAFQNAVNSGHAVYVPEGYFSIEGTIVIASGGSTQGGVTFIMTSNTRLERFSASVNDPIIQVVGDQNYVDGNGGILAARNVGGFTEGMLLVGVNPTVTNNNDSTCGDMSYNRIKGFKIIGKESNTAYDGSVGLYVNAAARKRGVWKTGGNTCNVYYNTFEDIVGQQLDFPIHVSSEASFNSFVGCAAKTYGHAALSLLGYGNSFSGFICETPSSQDSTERYVVYCGTVNDSFTPETGTNSAPSSTTAITGISAANPAVVTAASHGLSTTDKVLIRDVVDNGPNGDLETAVNDGFFEVIVLTTDTFSINVDGTALTNTYSSGGTIQTDFLPNLGSRANQVEGSAEWAYSATTAKVRLLGYSEPVGSYKDDSGAYSEYGYDGFYGNNIISLSGTHPGGAGLSGFSTRSSIRNNLVYSQSLRRNETIPENHHGFTFRTLDDGTSGYFGTAERASFSGRMAGAAESTAYNVLTVDNVGSGNGAIAIRLWYLMREDSNDDCETGEISWLCPVAGNSNQTAIKYKDFQASYNAAAQPYVTWSITDAAGTASNTGKFTLVATTADPAGADNTDIDITWNVDIIAEYGASLDFDGDVTVTNGGL